MNRWQFSIRGLLLLTAIVSVVLALAVTMPVWFQVMLIAAVPVLIIAALLLSANFVTSDRRPRLAMVSWAMLAGFFGFYSAAALSFYIAQAPESDGILSRFLFGVMSTCCIICVVRACRSLVQVLSGRKDATRGDASS